MILISTSTTVFQEISGLLSLSRDYWTIVLSIKCFHTVSRGPTSEIAFFEDFIGVKAYCLPEDETIGEFGFLLQLF